MKGRYIYLMCVVYTGIEMSKETSLIKTLANADAITEARKNAIRDEIKMPDGMWIVDTVFAIDTGEIETAIKKNEWVVVEQYGRDWAAAKSGHQKWVAAVKAGQKEFKTVLDYGF